MSNSSRMPGSDKQDCAQAADKTKDAAASIGEMASHAACAVGDIASQAACDAGKKADELTVRAGAGIKDLADRMSKSVPHDGVLGAASQAVAKSIKHGGEYLEGAKLSGVSEDIAHLVRQNPIPAILIAVGLGWFLGRKLRI